MTDDNYISFDTFCLFNGSPRVCRHEVYTAITSYILHHEHINLVKDIDSRETLEKLIEKYKKDPDFMKDYVSLRDDSLRCLELYCEYWDYIHEYEDDESKPDDNQTGDLFKTKG